MDTSNPTLSCGNRGGVGPYNGYAVVPEPFIDCAKIGGGACEDFRLNDNLQRSPSQAQAGQADIALIIDTTGSMWDDIARVKGDAINIIRSAKQRAPDLRVALIEYRDFPERTGINSDFPYRDILPFSDNTDAVVNAINRLGLGYGGDDPETLNCAVMHAVNGSNCANRGPRTNIGSWRNIRSKSIIYLTDAPALNPEPFTGFTNAESARLARQGDIALDGNGTSPPELVPSVASTSESSGIAIYPIVVGRDSIALAHAAELALGTGGQVFTAANAENVVDALLRALDRAIGSTVYLPLMIREGTGSDGSTIPTATAPPTDTPSPTPTPTPTPTLIPTSTPTNTPTPTSTLAPGAVPQGSMAFVGGNEVVAGSNRTLEIQLSGSEDTKWNAPAFTSNCALIGLPTGFATDYLRTHQVTTVVYIPPSESGKTCTINGTITTYGTAYPTTTIPLSLQFTVAPQYTLISLQPIANWPLDHLLNPPSGQQTYAGVPFTILSGNLSTFRSQTAPSPNTPTSASLAVNVPRPLQTHILINGDYVPRSFENMKVGEVSFTYASGFVYTADIIAWQTIRETWRYDSDNNAMNPSTNGLIWRNVISEAQWRGAPAQGFIDMVTIPLPFARQRDTLRSITIRDTSATTAASLDPGLAVMGVTVESVVSTSPATQIIALPAPFWSNVSSVSVQGGCAWGKGYFNNTTQEVQLCGDVPNLPVGWNDQIKEFRVDCAASPQAITVRAWLDANYQGAVWEHVFCAP
jgi:hypothetical protein